MTTHEVLVKARALLESPRDWGKDYGAPGVAPRCSVQAIHEATSLAHAEIRLAKKALARAIGEAPNDVCGAWIGDWNDAPETTHADVLRAFDTAIAATAPAPDMSWLKEPAAEYLVS